MPGPNASLAQALRVKMSAGRNQCHIHTLDGKQTSVTLTELGQDVVVGTSYAVDVLIPFAAIAKVDFASRG